MDMICITGGIGSGKSVVSRILRLRGFSVYDCDSRAKEIVDSDPSAISRLEEFAGCPLRGESGRLDRKKMAGILFSNADFRRNANTLIHGLVRDDIRAGMSAACSTRSTFHTPPFFVETAIPRVSGLESMASRIWFVTAPEELRVERVIARNGLSREQIESRMRSQEDEFSALDAQKTSVIANDGSCSLIMRIDELLPEM